MLSNGHPDKSFDHQFDYQKDDESLIRLNGKEKKAGGKNNGPFDGTYLGSDKILYFVKQPGDKIELFTELFAGLFIEECKKEGYIEKSEHDSLICANFVKLPNKNYALIQPLSPGEMLYRKIGTGNAANTDRSAWYEARWGTTQYKKIQTFSHQGLSTSLLWSLVIGDYSVHSGNYIAVKNGKVYKLRRIDLGAALRAIGSSLKNILSPPENSGLGFYKKITKNYITNFMGIEGLTATIGDKALHLQEAIDRKEKASFEEIILRVIKKIPNDMFTSSELIAIAEYIKVRSLSNVKLGEKNIKENVTFAEELATILNARINSTISELRNEEELSLYASAMDEKPNQQEIEKLALPNDWIFLILPILLRNF